MKRFAAICADPPWPFRDQGSRLSPAHRGRHYEVLTLDELCTVAGAMLQTVLAPDALLFLWCPNALVAEGVAGRVCHAWGFRPAQLIPWVKTTKDGRTPRLGAGHYTRVCTEQLVLARRGKPTVRRHDIPGILFAPRGAHSAKPDSSYALIEALARGPYLELYARRRFSRKWTAWGDQAPGQVYVDGPVLASCRRPA